MFYAFHHPNQSNCDFDVNCNVIRFLSGCVKRCALMFIDCDDTNEIFDA